VGTEAGNGHTVEGHPLNGHALNGHALIGEILEGEIVNGSSVGTLRPSSAPVDAVLSDAAVATSAATEVVEAPPVAPVSRRPRRIVWRLLTLVTATGVVVGVQLARPVPAPALHISVTKASHAPGLAPVLPWPATGEAAVAVPAAGAQVQSGPEAPVPIASLAKIMTGDLVLRDHPLAPGAQGPMIALGPADQAEAAAELAANATAVPVQAGETLTERQLLDGLLVHSANNFADVLARWDAGSTTAFVAKMNAAAVSLGMHSTHYADTSGLDDQTIGTAADQLLVAADAMAGQTFAAIVAQPSVTLPIAGSLPNYVKAVGTDGIVGVKSGFTQAAMGCLVLAAQRPVAGRTVLVLAAITGQPPPSPLDAAEQADLQLVDAAASSLRELALVPKGATVGRVTAPWAHRDVRAVASRRVTLLAWPGEAIRVSVSTRGVSAGATAGARIGTLSVWTGTHRVRVPVRLTAGVPVPSMGWRLAHG